MSKFKAREYEASKKPSFRGPGRLEAKTVGEVAKIPGMVVTKKRN